MMVRFRQGITKISLIPLVSQALLAMALCTRSAPPALYGISSSFVMFNCLEVLKIWNVCVCVCVCVES